MDVTGIQSELRRFASERDWEQFHSPKNLAMALAAEAGELLEVFQWLTEEESVLAKDGGKSRAAAEEELADVAIYVLRLADVLDVDLDRAIRVKMAKNGAKYPVRLARGNAKKYSDLESND